jgi:integrase
MAGRRGFRLKGLKRYTVGGTEYVYHRASGTALPAGIPETHPDFLSAYIEAQNTPPKPARNGAGSLEAVVNAYMHSPGYKALSASYRAVMRREYARLVDKAGHVPFTTICRRHILKDMAETAPNAANKRLKAWRNVCKFQRPYDNPADGIKAVPAPRIKGHTPWDRSDVDNFRERWAIESSERLAFELLFWTGARMSDAVRLGPGAIDADGWLNFRQQKTGGYVSIPVYRTPPEIAPVQDLAMLRQCFDAQVEKHLTWLVTGAGAGRSQKSASQWFSKAARSAGLTGKTAHGLRAARAIILAENGATTHQIGAWTGHESLKEIEQYSRAANKKKILSGAKAEHKLSKIFDP